MTFRVISLALGLLLMGCGAFVCAQEAAPTAQGDEWLSRMTQALRSQDYRGLLTYEFGGNLQSLRLTHRVMDGREYEQLQFLNGPDVRVDRQGNEGACAGAGAGLLKGQMPEIGRSLNLNSHYHFYLRGTERLAGRVAQVVHVIPKDNFRFGYSFSIDQESYLPLATLVMADKKRAVERLQFMELDLQVDDSWVSNLDASTRIINAPERACVVKEAGFQWMPSWLPSGFVATGTDASAELGEVRSFTDGLASVSVYVLPMTPRVAAQGKAQRGATVAYMEQVQHADQVYTVTVVGEVPARTAQRIANSIRWGGSAVSESQP